MNKSLAAVAILCVLMLSGCGGIPIQPILDSKQSPTTDSAYVAGMFSKSWGSGNLGFGLGIVNVASSREYVMPFGVETDLPNSVSDVFVMIQLPPGEYRIAYWVSYSNGEDLITQTSVQSDSVTGMPFKLAPGEVTFVGSYIARSQRISGSEENYTWSLSHQQLSQKTAQKILSRKYSSFSTLPISCPSCL